VGSTNTQKENPVLDDESKKGSLIQAWNKWWRKTYPGVFGELKRDELKEAFASPSPPLK
jgi:hypothetical protein